MRSDIVFGGILKILHDSYSTALLYFLKKERLGVMQDL